MNINDMMAIVDGVVEKVCYVDKDSNFEYRPELKDFYLWMYYCAFSDNKPEFEEDDNINIEKAFEFFSKEDELHITEFIPSCIRRTIENSIDKKIEYIINKHRDAKNISLTDVTLSEFINYLREKVNNNNDIIETIGKDNIINFVNSYSEGKIDTTKIAESMVENKMV